MKCSFMQICKCSNIHACTLKINNKHIFNNKQVLSMILNIHLNIYRQRMELLIKSKIFINILVQ